MNDANLTPSPDCLCDPENDFICALHLRLSDYPQYPSPNDVNANAEQVCPQSQRADGKHAWHFDGDDPYVICSWCGCMQDAITGAVIKHGTGHIAPPASDILTKDNSVNASQEHIKGTNISASAGEAVSLYKSCWCVAKTLKGKGHASGEQGAARAFAESKR
jgi:hypothetical protein